MALALGTQGAGAAEEGVVAGTVAAAEIDGEVSASTAAASAGVGAAAAATAGQEGSTLLVDVAGAAIVSGWILCRDLRNWILSSRWTSS